jgi:hypothetical protein
MRQRIWIAELVFVEGLRGEGADFGMKSPCLLQEQPPILLDGLAVPKQVSQG